MPNNKLGVTNHDYQGATTGNFYNGSINPSYESWEEYKREHYAFPFNGDIEPYDDTYHLIFRFDICESTRNKDEYTLTLGMMMQRKGIYAQIIVRNIDEHTLNTEVKEWLENRKKYLRELWAEIK